MTDWQTTTKPDVCHIFHMSDFLEHAIRLLSIIYIYIFYLPVLLLIN